MRLYYLLWLCFGPFVINAQLNAVWMAGKKVSLNNYGYCVSLGPGGNTYVSGQFTGSYRNPGPTEMGGFISCFNKEGVIQWHKEYYDDYESIVTKNAVDSKSNVVVAGPGIKRYTSNGDFLDSLSTSSRISWIKGLCIDKDDNIIAAGFYWEDSVMGEQIKEPNTFLSKYNPNGIKLWEFPCYINGGTSQDFDLTVDRTGNIYIAGGFNGPARISHDKVIHSVGRYDGFVAKVNPNGSVIWSQVFGGTRSGDSEYPHAITVSNTGDVYVAGTYFGLMVAGPFQTPAVRGQADSFLIKYDSDGNLQWLKSGGGDNLDKVREIAIDDNDNIFICGSYGSPQTFFWEGQPVTLPENDKGGLFVFQLDADGNPTSFTSGLGGHFRDLACDNKGNLYLTGQYANPFEFCGQTLEGEGGMCLVKVAYDMNNEVGLKEESSTEDLFHIFPNPGKDVFHISFSDDLCPDASIQVYETSGHCILSRQSIGCNERNFQCAAPPGVYLVELCSGLKRQTRKVIVQ